MILCLGIAIAFSLAVVKILLWLKIPCAWSVAVGIVCFVILIIVGIYLIKDMDAPPPGSTVITREELHKAAGLYAA